MAHADKPSKNNTFFIFPVLLIEPVGTLKPDVGRLEEVKLDFRSDISLFSEYAAIVVMRLDVIQIVDVVNTRLGQVV